MAAVIAVDLDEVLADTVSKRLRRYQADYGVPLTRAQIHGKQIRDAVPAERSRAVEACLDEPGFSRDIPVMLDAQDVLRDLANRFQIFIATTAMDHPNSLPPYFSRNTLHYGLGSYVELWRIDGQGRKKRG